MSGFRRSRALLPSLLLAFLFSLGCSGRSPDLPGDGANQTSQTPFQTQVTSASDHELRSSSSQATAEKSPPFQNAQVLPAGSLLTVSLKTPVTAGLPKDSFEATVDVPVSVDGNVVIPRGSTVSVRIESAHISKVQPDRAYVRLTLESLHIDSLSIALQTASLFARQPAPTRSISGTIRLEKGRRLTFRLIEPIFFSTQRAKSEL
jgi:hypothetical protein